MKSTEYAESSILLDRNMSIAKAADVVGVRQGGSGATPVNDPVFGDHDDILLYLERYLESGPDFCERANGDYALRQKLYEQTNALAKKAYCEGDAKAKEAATSILEIIYKNDFSLRGAELLDSEISPISRDMAAIVERHFLDFYLAGGKADDMTKYPTGGKEYVRWFKDVIQNHISSNHEFYEYFLPNKATREHLRFYLAQETNLDPRFDDILAQVQIGRTGQPKMEIAINYWDEMGTGSHDQVHTTLFKKTLDYLEVDDAYLKENLFPESVASGNMSSCLALYRRHNLRALGYFGTAEYIGPRRFKSLLKAWERNALDPVFSEYHRLHVSIDAIHGSAWLNNVIAPLVDKDPGAGAHIAQGMLLRLESSNDYLDALQKRLVAL